MSVETKVEENVGEPFVCGEIHLETVTCFICGSYNRDDNRRRFSYKSHSIVAPVDLFLTGRVITKMFNCGARFEHNPQKPKQARVLIGACDRHIHKLERLVELTKDGKISKDRVESARFG